MHLPRRHTLDAFKRSRLERRVHEIINYSVELGNYTVICPESQIIIWVYCFLPGGSSPIWRIYGHLKHHSTESYTGVITPPDCRSFCRDLHQWGTGQWSWSYPLRSL